MKVLGSNLERVSYELLTAALQLLCTDTVLCTVSLRFSQVSLALLACSVCPQKGVCVLLILASVLGS